MLGLWYLVFCTNNHKVKSMVLLAESENYIVSHEYETVTLRNKITHEEVIIGDFYGDPDLAVISKDEKFCVMGGCGIIVYFLQEPFEEYHYNLETPQWKELGRTPSNIIWVKNIKLLDEQYIEIEKENGELMKLNVFSTEIL